MTHIGLPRSITARVLVSLDQQGQINDAEILIIADWGCGQKKVGSAINHMRFRRGPGLFRGFAHASPPGQSMSLESASSYQLTGQDLKSNFFCLGFHV